MAVAWLLLIALFQFPLAEALPFKKSCSLRKAVKKIIPLPDRAISLSYGVAPKGPPALIAERVRQSGLGWYEHGIVLGPGALDPIFPAVARQLGKESILIGGGSDLVQAELGLAKFIPGKPRALTVEVNLLAEENLPPLERFTAHADFKFPAYQKRKSGVATLLTNDESNNDLAHYLENGKNGDPLVKNRYRSLNVPLKHTAVLEVHANGEGRFYFRTQKDYEDFIHHKLTLPAAEDMTVQTWLQAIGNSEQHEDAVVNMLRYSLVVASRGRALGWQFEQKSLDFLIAVTKGSTARERKRVLAELSGQVTEPQAKRDLVAVLKEIEFKNP